MSNLVPEKRMDRIGRMITRWVRGDDTNSQRNSLLGTVIPVIPASSGQYITDQSRRFAVSHDAISKKIEESLNADIAPVVEGRLKYISDPEDRELMTETHMRELRSRNRAVLSKLNGFEPETLEVLHTKLNGTRHLLRVLEKDWPNENEMRESVHFSQIGPNNNLVLPRSVYFRSIRERVFDVHSLSELPVGSTEYEAVQNTLDIIDFDYHEINTKKSKYRDMNVVIRDAEKKIQWAVPDKAVWLTGIMLAHPDRTEDIKQYLAERNVNINDVDEGHLEEYLNTAAPVLAEGAL